jgi:ribonuclease HII
MAEQPTEPVFAIDEAGRGPLWGPVIAGCVVLPLECPDGNPLWNAIRDSKKVSEKKRPIVAEYIKSVAITWGIGKADANEIDEINILQATMRSMHRAMDAAWRRCPVGSRPSAIWVDGPQFIPYCPPDEDETLDHACVVDGDATVRGIAAASILAKVFHDDWILAYVREHPEVAPYHLEKNKGYGTAAHMEALKTLGPHELHRFSFGPVRVAAARHII